MTMRDEIQAGLQSHYRWPSEGFGIWAGIGIAPADQAVSELIWWGSESLEVVTVDTT